MTHRSIFPSLTFAATTDPGTHTQTAFSHTGSRPRVLRASCGSFLLDTPVIISLDEQLQHIYKTGYWDNCCGDDLPLGIDYAVFDTAVNSGPGRSAKWLQEAVGVAQDGAIGPGTIRAVAGQEAAATIRKVLGLRLSFLQGLSTWPTFRAGWGKRVERVRLDALAMAGDMNVPAANE